jgi:hypothetical protein
MIDGTEQKHIIDDSATVRKICDKLGELMQMGKDAEQFCLCLPDSTIQKSIHSSFSTHLFITYIYYYYLFIYLFTS